MWSEEPAHRRANATRVIRVSIPVDSQMVARMGSTTFALATPLRVAELLRMSVLEALGSRAPEDKRERGVGTAIAGFLAGEFVLDVNGRRYRSLDDVVLCSGSATLRFFAPEAGATAAAG